MGSKHFLTFHGSGGGSGGQVATRAPPDQLCCPGRPHLRWSSVPPTLGSAVTLASPFVTPLPSSGALLPSEPSSQERFSSFLSYLFFQSKHYSLLLLYTSFRHTPALSCPPARNPTPLSTIALVQQFFLASSSTMLILPSCIYPIPTDIPCSPSTS